MNLRPNKPDTHAEPGTGGYGEKSHTQSPNVPARRLSSSLRASRTYSNAAVMLMVILSSLPAFAVEGGQATTLFDVPSGGVLSTLVGAAVSALGTWAAMRGRQPRQRASTKIEDQPVKVEITPGHTTDPLCDAKHAAVDGRLKDNQRDHDNLFPRLAAVESRVSTLEGIVGEMTKTNKSIDEKLTILLRRR